ncbi:MAG: LLM class flavin-dependent oxidoreductase [Gemmatimonas sp.]|nr:LLM class flavin-dependent oxidoreductase [Gemmatimonas sp.]
MDEMKFGTFHLFSQPEWMTASDVINGEVDQAVWAEQLGFHDVWIAEHSARVYGILGNAAIAMAAIAARTSRVRIGTAVTRTALHHPVHIAEDLAAVDVISNGRLDWGIGKGYDPHEFATYGIDFEEREERWQEAIDLVTSLWKEGSVAYKGKHYEVEMELFPKPVQRPSPPTYLMVSRSDESVRFAAEHLWPVVYGQGPDWDDTRHKMELFRETALEAGHREADVEAAAAKCAQLKQVHVAETTEQARSEYERGLMWYFATGRNRQMFGFTREARPYEYYLHHRNVMLGSPDDLSSIITEYREHTGVNNVLCWFNCGGQPADQVRNAMQMFSEQVMPRFTLAGVATPAS